MGPALFFPVALFTVEVEGKFINVVMVVGKS